MIAYRECRYLAEDGLSLYYRDYGDPFSPALPMLCLPGLTRNSSDFHRLATRLCGARRVVCPDYRGRGQSDYDPDPANYRPATHINDLRHLMAAAGLHRAIFVGTSFGGLLTMGLGLVAPSSIAAVILNDVGPEVDNAGLARIMDYIGRDHPMPDWASAVGHMKQIFPNLSHGSDEEWMAAARGTWREGDDGWLHFNWDTKLASTIGRASSDFDPWSLFRSLNAVPMLAFRGGVSDVLSSATLEKMERNHPALRAITIEGVGHPLSLSEPEAVEAIDEFLERQG